jgi:hypothetical protein
MHSAEASGWKASGSDRAKVIEAIDALPKPGNIGVSGAMIDALKSLGALDESEREHLASVRETIRIALGDEHNPDKQSLAFGAWIGQFDHPLEGAYCEAIGELSDSNRKKLLLMAASASDNDSMFLGILIADITAFNDPSVCALLARWTTPPQRDAVMPQDALGVFARSHIGLARLKCPLPATDEASTGDAEKTMIAAARLLYWLNRIDLPIETRRTNCADSLAFLTSLQNGVATSILRTFAFEQRSWMESLSRLPGDEPVHTSISEFFGDEVAHIYRNCLQNPSIQTGYFRFFEADAVFEFAVNGLGRYGSTLDLPLLRELVTNPTLGRAAIAAIGYLEQAQAPC